MPNQTLAATVTRSDPTPMSGRRVADFTPPDWDVPFALEARRYLDGFPLAIEDCDHLVHLDGPFGRTVAVDVAFAISDSKCSADRPFGVILADDGEAFDDIEAAARCTDRFGGLTVVTPGCVADAYDSDRLRARVSTSALRELVALLTSVGPVEVVDAVDALGHGSHGYSVVVVALADGIVEHAFEDVATGSPVIALADGWAEAVR